MINIIDAVEFHNHCFAHRAAESVLAVNRHVHVVKISVIYNEGITADVRTGLEYWYRDMLALRTGVNGKDLAFGAGLRYKQVGVDYAASLNRFFAADDPNYPSDTNLEVTHLVSLGVNW